MNRTVSFIILLTAIGIFTAAAQQREVDLKFQIAQTYERNNDWENALRLYEELYAKDSTNVVLFESVRRGYMQLKRYDDAVRLIHTYLRFRPKDIFLLSQLGVVHARAGEEVRAGETWKRAIAIDRRNPHTYRIVANAAVESRMLDRAVEYYLTARSETGDPALFAADIAHLHSMMMNFGDATREYLRLVRQNPTQLPFVQSRMASYTYRADGRNAAAAVVEDELRSHAENITFHQLLAWLLMEGKQFDKAYEVYLHIDRQTHANGREIYNFAERALKEKATTTAARAFQTLINQNPQFERLPAAKFGYARTLEESMTTEDSSTLGSNLSGMGNVYEPWGTQDISPTEARSKYTSVIAAYNDVVRDYPKSEIGAYALYRIAVIKFERLFDIDNTIAVLRQLSREAPRHFAEATLLLGDALLAKGNGEEAEQQYRSLVLNPAESGMDAAGRNTPIKEKAQFHLAEIEFFRGNFQTAVKLLQELTKNLNSDAANDALILLSLIQENSTQSSAALTEFAKANFLLRQRKLPDVMMTLESLQKKHPASPLADETLMLLGDVFTAMKRFTDGISAYEQLMNQNPESILLDKAQMKIGHIYQWRLHDRAKAIAAYQTFLEKYPNSIYAGEARKRIRELRGENL